MSPKSFAFEKQCYIADAEVKYRIPADQISAVIEDEFGGFNPSSIIRYDERLDFIRSQRTMNVGGPQERIPEWIPGQKCPICGSKIRHNYRWKSKNKDAQPFSCERTEISHYLEWRTAMIAQRFKEHYQKYPGSNSIAGSCPLEKLENQEPESENA